MNTDELEVLLLTRDDCAFCHDAEEILKHVAGRYPIRVKTLDLDTAEGRRLGEAAGVLFPPGILIDGRPFSYGRPSEKKLERELEKLLALRSS